MERLKENMIPFIKEAEIQEMIQKMCREVERDYAGQEVVLICPLKGSFIFVSDFMRELKLPQQVDFIQTKDTVKKGAVKIVSDITTNIAGKHVLIMEEIIDVGRSVFFIKERIAVARPKSLKVVALLDKPARRELPLRPDYVGMTIDDRYVVGYGMDSDEVGRNYKDIYYFTM